MYVAKPGAHELRGRREGAFNTVHGTFWNLLWHAVHGEQVSLQND